MCFYFKVKEFALSLVMAVATAQMMHVAMLGLATQGLVIVAAVVGPKMAHFRSMCQGLLSQGK